LSTPLVLTGLPRGGSGSLAGSPAEAKLSVVWVARCGRSVLAARVVGSGGAVGSDGAAGSRGELLVGGLVGGLGRRGRGGLLGRLERVDAAGGLGCVDASGGEVFQDGGHARITGHVPNVNPTFH
jgi:hypothetical protein